MFPKVTGVLPRMKFNDDALLGRRGHPLWLELLIFLAVFTVASTAESLPIAIATLILLFTDKTFIGQFNDAINDMIENGASVDAFDGLNETLGELVKEINSRLIILMLFVTVAAIVVVLIYCTKLEKRPLRSLGLRKAGAVPEYLVGLGIGTAMFAAAVGICALTGGLELKLDPVGPVALLPVFFVGYMIQGMSEELLCRGYLMVSMSRRSSAGMAIFFSSLVFSMLHVENPDFGILAFINIVLFGAFAGVYFNKRGSIWGIAAIHSAWNFVQGCVFGVNVSGITGHSSIMTSVVGEGSKYEIWNGGAFGLEGGLAVTVVLSMALLVTLLIIPSKRSELSEVVPEKDADTGEA